MNHSFPEVELFCKDSKNKIRRWAIRGDDYTIITAHGLVGGAEIVKRESVSRGKGGRDRGEQMALQILSTIKRKRDKGYVESLDIAATEKRTNAAGLLRPMLAHPLEKMSAKDTIEGAFWSRKLNGHRCLITKREGTLLAYSRNGKPIDLPHLFEGLVLDEGETLDGELYIHGVELRTLSSLIRAPKAGSTELKFHCYDYVSDSLVFKDRYALLLRRFGGFRNVPNVVVCEHIEIREGAEMHELTAQAVADGYEGGIIRLADSAYLDGKKTNKMLKLKSFQDAEFLVVDIVPSRDGWAVLTCLAANGKEFGCSAPGNRAAQFQVMKNKENFIGRTVQVKYFELTKDGIPFHPVPSQSGWVDRGVLG